MTDQKNEYTLDVRKLLCPLPVIRLQQIIQNLSLDTIILVMATDPGVLYDIPAWCRIHGHTVLETEKKEREIFIKVQVNKTKKS
jgi:tRNA 2-thiouridine synthesizing protein A